MSAKNQIDHRPFLIRKSIFFVGLAAALFCAYFLDSWLLGLCVYFVSVTVVDFLVTYAFGLRASSLSDPKQLLLHEKISPPDLDRHYDSRRNIRGLSLLMAGLSQLIVLSPELFCGVYVGVSLLSVLYTKYVLKIVGPRAIYRDNASQSFHSHRKSSIDQTFDQLIEGQYGYGLYRRLSE